jgi:hypothetical protein
MAKLGRPSLGDNKMVSISLRLPKHVYEQYKQSDNPSALMRKVLENYMLTNPL